MVTTGVTGSPPTRPTRFPRPTVQWFEGRGERLWLYGFKNADQGHSDVLGLSSPPPCGYGFAREIQPAAQADPPDCPDCPFAQVPGRLVPFVMSRSIMTTHLFDLLSGYSEERALGSAPPGWSRGRVCLGRCPQRTRSSLPAGGYRRFGLVKDPKLITSHVCTVDDVVGRRRGRPRCRRREARLACNLRLVLRARIGRRCRVAGRQVIPWIGSQWPKTRNSRRPIRRRRRWQVRRQRRERNRRAAIEIHDWAAHAQAAAAFRVSF